ncbi:MAG: LytTR family DNA-binding domain-containing protein [Pseudomonadota bacterium]
MPDITDSSRQFLKRMLAAWAVLTLLFAGLGPEVSAPLGFGGRLLFWALHIGFGLVCAALATRLLVDKSNLKPDWRLIFVAAVLGVMAFAPIALALERLFPTLETLHPDDALDQWASDGFIQALVAEALSAAPSFIPAWLLINLDAVWQPSTQARTDTNADAEPVLPFALPAAIGTDLVAISADLHYLHVYTRAGKAMVLGSLASIAESLGERGMLVHRSHWIAVDQVVRLRKTAKQWHLDMHGDLSVPISRRKRKAVVERLGQDFEVASSDSSGDGVSSI